MVSIIWTTTSSAVGVAIGVASGTLVLVVFGLAGLLDTVGSTALVVHFRHALAHESFSEKHERIARLLVRLGLVVLAVLTVGEAVHRLITGVSSHRVPAGLLLPESQG